MDRFTISLNEDLATQFGELIRNKGFRKETEWNQDRFCSRRYRCAG